MSTSGGQFFPVYPLISVLNNVAEGAEILGRAAWVGGVLMRIKTARFGEVRWGLHWQIWGAEAYLGQRALRHKQLGLPFLVYASRRGGLLPSRLAVLSEPAELCGFWIGGGHHQRGEGEGNVEILGAGGREKDQRKGSKTLVCVALSTHVGLSGSVNGGEIRKSVTHTAERNLQKGL